MSQEETAEDKEEAETDESKEVASEMPAKPLDTKDLENASE